MVLHFVANSMCADEMVQHAETNSPSADTSVLKTVISDVAAKLCEAMCHLKDVKDKLDIERLGSVELARNIAGIDANYRLVENLAA